MPRNDKPVTSTQPEPPTESDPPQQAAQPSIPLSEYNRVCDELQEWHAYGQKSQAYMHSSENARSVLDTRQTVLRTSLYGIVCLAFFVCLAGFAAPSIVPRPNGSLPTENFLPHLGYLAGPFAVVGFILGAVVFRVRVTTTAYSASRCALIASSLVGLVSTLVSLPYTAQLMWNQNVTAGPITMRMLLWLALFRLILTPFVCALFACVGFYAAKLLSRKPPQVEDESASEGL